MTNLYIRDEEARFLAVELAKSDKDLAKLMLDLRNATYTWCQVYQRMQSAQVAMTSQRSREAQLASVHADRESPASPSGQIARRRPRADYTSPPAMPSKTDKPAPRIVHLLPRKVGGSCAISLARAERDVILRWLALRILANAPMVWPWLTRPPKLRA